MDGNRTGGRILSLVTRARAARQGLRDRLAPYRAALIRCLRAVARPVAYTLAFLLSVVWISSALASLTRPLLDLGKARIGDAIIAFAGDLSLSPNMTLGLAQALVGARLFIGIYLLIAIVYGTYERLRWRTSSDEMLNVGLFLSAIATIVAVAPVIMEPEPRLQAIGELILCVMASGLATFARDDDLAIGEASRPGVNPPSFQRPPESPQLP